MKSQPSTKRKNRTKNKSIFEQSLDTIDSNISLIDLIFLLILDTDIWIWWAERNHLFRENFRKHFFLFYLFRYLAHFCQPIGSIRLKCVTSSTHMYLNERISLISRFVQMINEEFCAFVWMNQNLFIKNNMICILFVIWRVWLSWVLSLESCVYDEQTQVTEGSIFTMELILENAF